MKYSWNTKFPKIESYADKHNRSVAIVCGGSSLKDNWRHVKGKDIAAVNGSYDYLLQKDVIADLFIMMDARPDNIQFIHNIKPRTMCLIASTCDKKVFKKLKDCVIWNPFLGIGEPKDSLMIGGGSTVGTRAIYLLYILGYRDFHLIGMDGCYKDGNHHAYTQELNNNEKVYDYEFDNKTYTVSSWMERQAEDFKNILKNLDAKITVYGESLIADLWSKHARN